MAADLRCEDDRETKEKTEGLLAAGCPRCRALLVLAARKCGRKVCAPDGTSAGSRPWWNTAPVPCSKALRAAVQVPLRAGVDCANNLCAVWGCAVLGLRFGIIVFMNVSNPAADGLEKTKSRVRSDRMQGRLDATRRAIMDAALELFDAEPYRVVPIRRIMEKAGYSTGTFYNFFQDKEDLIAQAAGELMAAAGTFLQEIPAGAPARQRLETMMGGAARFIADNASLVNLFMEAVATQPEVARSHGSTHAVASVAFTRKIIEEGQALGELRSDVNAQVAAELLQNCLGAPRRAPVDDAGRKAFVEGVLAKTAIVLDALEPR